MVSQTVSALATAVGEELLVVNGGGSLSTVDQATFIDRLQRLIDSMAIQRPLIFSERLDTLTLSANQQAYTIGIDPTNGNTANLQVPRPTRILRANLLLSSTVRRPIHPIPLERWAAIRYQQVYGPPREVYYDHGYASAAAAGTSMTGFGVLKFYLIPDQAYNFELYSAQQQQQISAIGDLINYPPGYADFLLYAMVIRCASMFGKQPTQMHIDLFQDARQNLTSMNSPSPELAGGDAAHLNDDGGGLYNWLDGQVEAD